MFDRFRDSARLVFGLAREEAQRSSHDYVGTQHILVGLIRGRGVAADVLKSLSVDLQEARQEIEKLVSFGTGMVTVRRLPFTPRAKKVLEMALEEESNLSHDYIGTEHLLVGTIRVRRGIAAKVLRRLGVRLEDVRDQVNQRRS